MKSSLIGRTLGKYEIRELLGQGGMATVYKGYQPDIDRYVAIKVLPPHPGQDMQFVDRFMLEARTIARLQHPHILPVYDFGTQDDILYLAIAYIQGGSLSDRIDSGPMPLNQIERILNQLAAALDYAHRQGVIHRDIKPDNILLDGEGNVLLADFGIAKLAGGDSRLTATGGLVGTPAYIAPEQGQGLPVTSSVDIYSLGVVVYEMISGKQPFSAETPMQVVLKHMTEPVPHITEEMEGLPLLLEEVMHRVLAKNPADRYETASGFAQDFSRVIRSTEAGLNVVLTPRTNINLKTTPETSGTINFTVPATTEVITAATNPTPTPTVIMQPNNNSVLLLGGLGIIALLIVAIVVLVLFALDRNNEPNETDLQATTVALQTTQEIVAEPTIAPTLAPNFGSVTYGSVNSIGDTINLRVERFAPTSPGEQYLVWLRNTETGDTVPLGKLNTDALGSGVLTYTDPDGRLLPSVANAVIITRQNGEGEADADAVAYSGSVPLEVAHALNDILVASTENDGSSLFASIIAEAEIGAQHAGLAADADSLGGMQTHAEHTINILQGGENDYNGNGRGENPGRSKLGLPYYLDQIEQRLDTAINAPGATTQLQSQAELIRVCLQNVRSWVDDVTALEQNVFTTESIDAVADQVNEAQILAQNILEGTDLNGNSQIEPFEGECGLKQIESFGVLVGGMSILEGALPTAE